MAYGEALQALADPTRRSVLEALRAGPLAVSEIAARVPVSRPAVSQHLKVLKDAGIVTETRAGTRHYFAIQPATVAELRTYFETMWKQSLRAYAQYVETEEAKHASRNRRVVRRR
jgi:DNA-binding transcriptional ArsR family regulator